MCFSEKMAATENTLQGTPPLPSACTHCPRARGQHLQAGQRASHMSTRIHKVHASIIFHVYNKRDHPLCIFSSGREHVCTKCTHQLCSAPCLAGWLHPDGERGHTGSPPLPEGDCHLSAPHVTLVRRCISGIRL